MSTEMKVMLAGLAGTALLVTGLVFLIQYTQKPSPAIPLAEIVGEAPHTRGGAYNANATMQVVLVEFSDFQCPFCKLSQTTIKQIEAAYGDKVVFVYRHFPLKTVHANAFAAAVASEAADKQGKFWEMHDLLFAKQDEWSKLDNPKVKFAEYAKELSLAVDQFTKDMDDIALTQRVEKDFQKAGKLGLNATPTFFLNGEKVEAGLTFDEWQKKIDKLLASQPSPTK